MRSLAFPCALALAIAGSPLIAQPPQQADWTVMVFMNGDNNLEPFALADFAEMAKVGTTDRVNVLVQFDRIGDYTMWEPNFWTRTHRFRVTRGMRPEPGMAVTGPDGLDGVNGGEVNMGDPAALVDFVRWAQRAYPARRYFLVIWDHGQGYRAPPLVRSRRGLDPETLAAINPLAMDPFRSSSASPFRSVSDDETSGDHLFNREIQDALEPLTVAAPIDVIGFDACLMAMVETAYALRRVGTVMVASEELEPGPGWNYTRVIESLVNTPSMDAEALGRAVVKAFEDTYSPGSEATTLSAVRLGAVEALADRISKLADLLRANLATVQTTVAAARAASAVYAPDTFLDGKDRFQHVDLGRFLDQLVVAGPGDDIRNEALQARDALRAAVISAWAHPSRREPWGSHGLAIYFPVDQPTYEEDLYEKGGYRKDNTLFPVEFVQRHRWVDFLHAYLATTVE